MAYLGEPAQLIVLVACCMSTIVSGSYQQALNYQNFLNEVRGLLSHPYRHQTAVMNGGRGVSYVSLNPLTSDHTSVELILSHRDLYVLGYRTIQNGQWVVYMFADANINDLNHADYQRAVMLNFGGSYTDLEHYVGAGRQAVDVSVHTLRRGIQLLQQEPNQDTVNERTQRAQIMLALVMVVSEASRFTEIANSIQESLYNDNGETWHATPRHIALMNNWDNLSTFIIDNSQDVTASSTRWFQSLNQHVTVSTALGMMAVIARCFQRSSRRQRQTTPAECRVGAAVDAALADGVNNVYLFNGPNFVHIQFTPGTTDDRIIGGVKSIYSDWSFLRGTVFIKGLDAAFRVPDSNNAYIFKGGDYALININSKSIINGPKTIWDSWPSLRPTVFVNGIDAAIASISKNEVYLFRGNQYALVNFAPGTKDDWIINGPKSIFSSWSSLRYTAFINGLDAAFARPDKTEAYLFRGDHYVLVNYAPGSTNDWIINGPLLIRQGWPSLRNTAFDI